MSIQELQIRRRTRQQIPPAGTTSALEASPEFLAQRLAAIVESSDDAIISKDLNGVIQTWNRGAERVFGYTAEEAVGKPVTILIPPDRIDEEPGILARIRRGERIDHYETVRRRKDGSLIDISLTVSPIRDGDGRVAGASKIARDITERKKAENAVRDSERKLQELFSSIPAAIYTTDAEGRITYFNDAAVELAGRTPTLGSDEWCVTWKLYRPDGTPMRHDECPMAVALKEGRTIRDAEAIAERPDGTRVPFIPYPTLLRDERGKIVGAINMLVDISERRQAETQQRMLLRELNHRVKNNMQMLQSLLYAAARKRATPKRPTSSTKPAGASPRWRRRSGCSTPPTRPASRPVSSSMRFARARNRRCRRTSRSCARRRPANCPTTPPCRLPDPQRAPDQCGQIRRQWQRRLRHSRRADQGGRLFVLYVEDDGPGFDLKTVASRSSGLGLVQGLAGQLRGHFEVTRNPATRCTLRFA